VPELRQFVNLRCGPSHYLRRPRLAQTGTYRRDVRQSRHLRQALRGQFLRLGWDLLSLAVLVSSPCNSAEEVACFTAVAPLPTPKLTDCGASSSLSSVWGSDRAALKVSDRRATATWAVRGLTAVQRLFPLALLPSLRHLSMQSMSMATMAALLAALVATKMALGAETRIL
jgi:hypothetical protein